MLILKTVARGAMHGYAIAEPIEGSWQQLCGNLL